MREQTKKTGRRMTAARGCGKRTRKARLAGRARAQRIRGKATR